MWVLQKEDSHLPKWLTNNLKDKCECGGDMENFYNPAGEITARRCNNPKCPYIMAEKVVGVANLLGIKGIGSKTAFKIIKEHKLEYHLEAIPYILEGKPKVSLYTYLRMLYIQGIDTGWSTEAEKYKTLEGFLERYDGKYAEEISILQHKIRACAEYVEIEGEWTPKYEPLIRGTVMISGNIRGLNNRNDLIGALNYKSEGLVQLSVSESKRKTGVMALIQETDTPNRGKAECAIENGIPIMTPQEFIDMITARLNKLINEKGVMKIK